MGAKKGEAVNPAFAAQVAALISTPKTLPFLVGGQFVRTGFSLWGGDDPRQHPVIQESAAWERYLGYRGGRRTTLEDLRRWGAAKFAREVPSITTHQRFVSDVLRNPTAWTGSRWSVYP